MFLRAADVIGCGPFSPLHLSGDQAHEQVDPANRALRIGDRRGALRERHALHQFDYIDAASLQHRASLGQLEAVHGEDPDLVLDSRILAASERIRPKPAAEYILAHNPSPVHPLAPGADFFF